MPISSESLSRQVDPGLAPAAAVTQVICAGGGLIWKATSDGPRLAIIRRGRYGPEWALPKGKLLPGEAWAAGALREGGEETCCRVTIESFAGGLSYLHRDRPKVVLFWNMRLEEEHAFEPSEEVLEVRWVSRREALNVLTHGDEKGLVRGRGRTTSRSSG
jgi:ADP-ribose pyrophosphatase YjhB (NUDIX family)